MNPVSTANNNLQKSGPCRNRKSKESLNKSRKKENPCRIGLTGDIHYHTWANFGVETESGQSRLLNLAQTMNRLLMDMSSAECDTIILLGDIFHKRGTVSVEALHSFATFVARAMSLNINLKILVGNHDMDRRDNTIHALEVFKSVSNVKVYDTVVTDYVHDEREEIGLFIPYQDDHRVIQKTLKTLSDGPDYIFGHFGVANAKLINTDFAIDKGVDLTKFTSKTVKGIFLGHYHTAQKLDCPVPAYYVGSPLPHTFNDENVTKQVSILNLDDATVSTLPTQHLEFITVNATKNEDITREVYKPAYYRVRISGFTLDQRTAKVARTTAYPGGIEFNPSSVKNQEPRDRQEQFNINSVISSYVKNINSMSKAEVYKLVSDILKESL